MRDTDKLTLLRAGTLPKDAAEWVEGIFAERDELRLALIAAHGQAGDNLTRAVNAEADARAWQTVAESNHQMAQSHAERLDRARDDGLEEAARCCDDEADKCDDAVKWGGGPKYIAACKGASFAIRNRAHAIRALKSSK